MTPAQSPIGSDQDDQPPLQYRPRVSEADGSADGAGGADETQSDQSDTTPRRATKENGRSRRLEYPPAPEPLPVPVYDNHTHLDFRDGLVTVDVSDVLDAAEAVGVHGAVQVGCDVESSRFTVEAVDRDPRLLGAVAIHPNDSVRYAARGELDAAIAQIEEFAAHPRIRAIGETGLDYFRTAREDADPQHDSFRAHIDMANRLGLALQIHDRDAHDDVVAILGEFSTLPTVVFHSFSGGPELARICNERGWLMSFSGTVTFTKNETSRDALRIADPGLIMVETDAPFLTPHPWRGRPNASYLIPVTVRAMAAARGADVDEFCARIAETTRRTYGSFSD